MKNRVVIIYSIVLLCVFVSCNLKKRDKIQKRYYETGELYMMRKDINEREYLHRIYYRNGQLQAE